MPKTSIYLSSEDHEYLVEVVARMSQKRRKLYTLSQVIKLLIRLLKIFHREGLPKKLEDYFRDNDEEILDLLLAKP